MKKTLIALAALALSGCASIEHAGYDQYTVRAVKDVNGKTDGYELDVKSGKEYATRGVQFETNGKAAALVIGETDAKAFKGQALTVKAINILPTSVDSILGK